MPPPPQPPQKIHVGNLPASATEAQVRALFTPHGPIVAYHRPLSGPKRVPGSLAYITMLPADAGRAVLALDGRRLGGHILKIHEAAQRRQRVPNK